MRLIPRDIPLFPRPPSEDKGEDNRGCLASGVAYFLALIISFAIGFNFDLPEWLAVLLSLFVFFMIVGVMSVMPMWLLGIITACVAGGVTFLVVRGGLAAIFDEGILIAIVALLCGLLIGGMVFLDARSINPPKSA